MLDKLTTTNAMGGCWDDLKCQKNGFYDLDDEEDNGSNFSIFYKVSKMLKIKKNQIAVARFDGIIKIWDYSNESCLKVLGGRHASRIRSLIRIGKSQIASGSEDNLIKIWDFDTGLCLKTLTAHDNISFGLTKLSNNQIVGCTVDFTIKIWDSKTGDCIKSIKDDEYFISLVKLNKTQIVCCGYLGIIRIKNLDL